MIQDHYKESRCLSSKADTVELLKDFAAMANATGGIIFVGIRETDGRPVLPLKAGLQSVRNVDQQINRLHQLISTHFGEVAPKVEIRSLEVLAKRLLLTNQGVSKRRTCRDKKEINWRDSIPRTDWKNNSLAKRKNLVGSP
jgi:predicted HTH transcriptional regulator